MQGLPIPSAMTLALLFLLLCLVVLVAMLGSVSKGGGMMMAATRLFPWIRPLVVREEREGLAQGFTPHASLDHLVGREGVLQTDARPIGKALFGFEMVEVVAEGELLRRGSRVLAVAVRTGEVLVRPARGATRPPAP